jgi:hypothetical protein
VDPISTLATYAAAGAFGGAALALATRREESAERWMIRGTVVGGILGLIIAVLRGLF